MQAALPAFRAEALRRTPAPNGRAAPTVSPVHLRPTRPSPTAPAANAPTTAPAASPGAPVAAAPEHRTPAHEALHAALTNFLRITNRTWPSADGPLFGNAVMAAFTARPDAWVGPVRPACQPTSVVQWASLMTFGRGLTRAAAAEPGNERDDILCVPPTLDRLFPPDAAPVADLDASFEALARAGDDARRSFEALGASLPILRASSSYGSNGLDIATLSLDRVGETVQALQQVRTSLEAVEREWNRPAIQALWLRQPNGRALGATFQTTRRALTAVARMLRIAGALDIEALRDRGVSNVGAAFNALRSLGGPVIARLGPILSIIPLDRPITVATMLVMLEHITPEDIVVSLGVAPARGRWCDDDERSLACWLQRITAVIREVTDVQDARVTIDSDRLVRTLGSLGDDFRRRREWRAYFHLTIGLGEMLTLTPRAGGAIDTAFVPVMAEQIGLGVASPSFARDRLGFRAGVFGSGLLYRLVLNSRESEAFYFGGFAALDLYELLEVFVAPVAIVYPPGSAGDSLGFGVVAGASVPLADYLSRL